MSVHK